MSYMPEMLYSPQARDMQVDQVEDENSHKSSCEAYDDDHGDNG